MEKRCIIIIYLLIFYLLPVKWAGCKSCRRWDPVFGLVYVTILMINLSINEYDLISIKCKLI